MGSAFVSRAHALWRRMLLLIIYAGSAWLLAAASRAGNEGPCSKTPPPPATTGTPATRHADRDFGEIVPSGEKDRANSPKSR